MPFSLPDLNLPSFFRHHLGLSLSLPLLALIPSYLFVERYIEITTIWALQEGEKWDENGKNHVSEAPAPFDFPGKRRKYIFRHTPRHYDFRFARTFLSSFFPLLSLSLSLSRTEVQLASLTYR